MRWLKELWAKLRDWWRDWRKPDPSPITDFQLELDDMNIRGTWALPTTRASGLPLSPDDIDFTRIDVSLDGGNNWTELTRVPPSGTQEFFIPDAEIGTWNFRGIVFDTDGRDAPPVTGSATVPDETAPGPITDFNITLE